MWEFSLACNNKNKLMLDYINQCFCQDLPDCMLTTYKDDNFTYLLFACDERIAEICKDKIKHCLVTYIIDVYKYDYFTNAICKGINQTLTLQAYIKALTLYDVETDIVFIKQSFDLDKQFYLDSFLNFRMFDILRMWNELCELVKSNINYLNPDMMIDVMRSFISTFNTSVKTLKIIIDHNTFALYRIEDNKPPVKLKDNAPPIDIINYTMLANPNNIEIYGDVGENFSTISLLKSLYEDKVKVIN